MTAYLVFVQKEDPVAPEDADLDVKQVYGQMWSIIKLKRASAG